MIVPQRSNIDLKNLKDTADISEIITQYNELVRMLNFTLKFLSFRSNFEGYIAEVTFPAATSVTIQHFLGVTPKWRVILRQEGNGVLSDIPSGWNDKSVIIRNNGAGVVKASILIARE